MPILYFSWKLNSASTVFQCLQAIAKLAEGIALGQKSVDHKRF